MEKSVRNQSALIGMRAIGMYRRAQTRGIRTRLTDGRLPCHRNGTTCSEEWKAHRLPACCLPHCCRPSKSSGSSVNPNPQTHVVAVTVPKKQKAEESILTRVDVCRPRRDRAKSGSHSVFCLDGGSAPGEGRGCAAKCGESTVHTGSKNEGGACNDGVPEHPSHPCILVPTHVTLRLSADRSGVL
jgi:hypothetical protein